MDLYGCSPKSVYEDKERFEIAYQKLASNLAEDDLIIFRDKKTNTLFQIKYSVYMDSSDFSVPTNNWKQISYEELDRIKKAS